MYQYDFTKHDISSGQAQTLTAITRDVYDVLETTIESTPACETDSDTIISDTNDIVYDFVSDMEKRNHNQKYLSILGAGLVISLRRNTTPLRIEEVVDIVRSGSENSAVTKSKVTGWKHKIDAHRGEFTQPLSPTHYIHRYGDRMGIKSTTKDMALELAEQADLSGRSPSVAAARFLWIAIENTDSIHTQSKLVNVADTNKVSIRKGIDSIDDDLIPQN